MSDIQLFQFQCEDVTEFTVTDFELLFKLGVFNGKFMNDEVCKFKRYKDASLEYSGFNKHESEDFWDLWFCAWLEGL